MSPALDLDRPAGAQSRFRQFGGWARKSGPKAALELLATFALPYLIYRAAKPLLGDVEALMAAAVPPILWTIIEFARRRRIDALSILVSAGIILSLIAFFGGGGARALQMREQLVTAIIGVVFLTSAAIGKPLIYHLARARIARHSPDDAQSFEKMRDGTVFRRAMILMTLVWGVCLVVEAGISSVLTFVLTIQQYLLVGPVLGYSALGALTLWTFWYAKRSIGRASRS